MSLPSNRLRAIPPGGGKARRKLQSRVAAVRVRPAHRDTRKGRTNQGGGGNWVANRGAASGERACTILGIQRWDANHPDSKLSQLHGQKTNAGSPLFFFFYSERDYQEIETRQLGLGKFEGRHLARVNTTTRHSVCSLWVSWWPSGKPFFPPSPESAIFEFVATGPDAGTSARGG